MTDLLHDLLTAPEAAAELGVHRDTTRRAAVAGLVPGARIIGTSWVATRAAWGTWFETRKPAGWTAGRLRKVHEGKNFPFGTESLLADLRAAGHQAEPTTAGTVIVDGFEVSAASWNFVTSQYDGDLEWFFREIGA